MAKLHLSRLEKKYGKTVTGSNYRALMSEIIASNADNVSRAVLRLQDDKFKQSTPVKQKVINLPDITDVLPKRSVFTRKAADKGAMMTDNLRDQLTKNLRAVLESDKYIRRRGSLAGTLKESALADFEATIKQTFQNYTKKDPRIGIPSNVHTIAVTELRSTVNNIKDEYMGALVKKNDDAEIMKEWRHNGRMVKTPRMHHREISGLEIPYNREFVMYNKVTGNTVHCNYPHDPDLPPEEVIGCQCEVIYRIRKRQV